MYQESNMTKLLKSLIREAVNFEANAFDADEGVNGTDLVEWLAQWRVRAKAAIRPVSVQASAVRCGASRRPVDPP